MMLSLTHGMKFGVRKAAISSTGVIISTMIQAGISIMGLGAILLASELLFLIIKISGAIYLAYLGIMILLSSNTFYTDFTPEFLKPTFKRLLTQGFMVSIFNPKAVIFFTAFFPQFINKANATFSSYFILLITLVIVHFICSMVYAFAGKRVILFFKNCSKTINKAIGFFFLITGLYLVFSSVYQNYISVENK